MSAGMSLLLARWRSPLNVLDLPNERSLHTRPVPRTGGLAILAGLIAGSVVAYPILSGVQQLAWVVSGAGVLAAGSYLDDHFDLPVVTRLVVHFAAAGLLLYPGLSLCCAEMPGATWGLPGAIGYSFSMLFAVWMINLYNFMDGMDGFAGGMAVAGFSGLALIGWLQGHISFAVVGLLVASAAGGFLSVNFPPARIFMGDVGSSLLGLLAAAMSLWGAHEGIFPFWVAVLVFSPFIVDATVTLAKRLARGEKAWEAHRSHYYQRLVQVGWGHRRTVLWEYALMLGVVASAVVAVDAGVWLQWVIITAWAATYVILAAGVMRLEARTQGRGSG